MKGTRGFKPFLRPAAVYASFRPRYPAALFDFAISSWPRALARVGLRHRHGHAAVDLAAHFERVIATDALAAQLEHAPPPPRIEYRQAPAEESGIASARSTW